VRFKAAQLLPEQLVEGFEFVTNFNESIFPAVIPGLRPNGRIPE
jgi:hypothetical protein